MVDIYGGTALMSAASKGHPEIVKLLIPHESNMTMNDGKTALLHAVKNNNEEIVKLLIPFEADLIRKDSIDVLVEAYGRAC